MLFQSLCPLTQQLVAYYRPEDSKGAPDEELIEVRVLAIGIDPEGTLYYVVDHPNFGLTAHDASHLKLVGVVEAEEEFDDDDDDDPEDDEERGDPTKPLPVPDFTKP